MSCTSHSQDAWVVLAMPGHAYGGLHAQLDWMCRKAEDLLKLERNLFSVWMGWLTSSWMHDMNKGGFVKVLKKVDQELQRSEVRITNVACDMSVAFEPQLRSERQPWAPMQSASTASTPACRGLCSWGRNFRTLMQCLHLSWSGWWPAWPTIKASTCEAQASFLELRHGSMPWSSGRRTLQPDPTITLTAMICLHSSAVRCQCFLSLLMMIF